MQYIGIDLGSTNMKAAVYDETFHCIASQSAAVIYDRSNGVEFDAEEYWKSLAAVLKALTQMPGVKAEAIRQIGLTGQAETLVVLDADGEPLMNAISWMDERSKEECQELARQFSPEECESVTGQMAVLPTWPATKILWLKKHRPEIYEKAASYMLLKDYIVYRLTGKQLADCSIATFSFYFDIYHKCYWQKMLDAIGVRKEQLPPLAEPCTEAGGLTKEASDLTGLSESVVVNVGTLDHFAGMIGTGNVEAGGISLSTGTVMALATMAVKPEEGQRYGIAMHYGFLPDTYVMLPVAESGGVSLEWFKRTCMPGIDYGMLNEELAKRELPNDLIFLPYLVGTNAPEFDGEARGLFYGLRSECDVYDMAAAVMEGVAFLLRKNCDAIEAAGTKVRHIIATGGGAKSPIWCQMQADITGLPVVVPRETEAACLGAAMAGAVADGAYASYGEAAKTANGPKRQYEPGRAAKYEKKYKQFCKLYQAMIEVAGME